MTVFIVTSEDWTKGCMGDHYCNARVAALSQAGAVHRDISEIEREPAGPDDVVISFVHPPGSQFQARVRPENRWLFCVDESIGGEPPYARQLRRCKEHNLGGCIVTYANPAHLQVLSDAGIKACYFPLVMGPKRQRRDKTHTILISGQTDPKTYPERHRLRGLFPLAHELAHPGYWPNLRHSIVGDRYLELLDCYELIVTDCAGWRDRFVAKYYEAAQCHALPIGSIPSYIIGEVRDHLFDTAGMSDDEVRAEVTCLLSNRDVLHRMQDDFSEAMYRHYDPLKHAFRVMWEVCR